MKPNSIQQSFAGRRYKGDGGVIHLHQTFMRGMRLSTQPPREVKVNVPGWRVIDPATLTAAEIEEIERRNGVVVSHA